MIIPAGCCFIVIGLSLALGGGTCLGLCGMMFHRHFDFFQRGITGRYQHDLIVALIDGSVLRLDAGERNDVSLIRRGLQGGRIPSCRIIKGHDRSSSSCGL